MTSPATPRDDIGLSERLRDTANKAARDATWVCAPLREAATQLDAQAAELERVERNRDMWKGQSERQAKALTELREEAAELVVCQYALSAAESRATRAEQERDEALERAAKVADKKADDLLATAASLGSCSGATKLDYTEADLHEQAGTVIRAFAAAIRRLAAGDEEGK